MSRIIKPTLIFIAIFLFPAVASAVDMDFYTYGGFQPVVDAFTQLTLIFGNNDYQTLYYTAVVCGIACGVGAAFMMLIGGRGNNILGWAPTAALGMAIFMGLFVPKGNLVVYDPVFNKFQTVPNVPDGVVIVAGTLNAIEQALVNIVSNSASPTGYQTQAGGIGYMALYNLATQPATASSSFLDQNIDRYVQDCVSFALNNPGSGLTVDELRKTTTNFATSFAKAENPAITTLYYSAAVPQGAPIGCDADWAQISGTDLTAAALLNNIQSACSTLNYDVTDPLQVAQCQTNMINLAQSGNLTTGDINSLMQQIYLYNRLDQYYQSGNTSAITNYNFLMNASGSMKAADEWIPILKAALTAIAVALIPFLAIFIPTPICGKALNLMFGMFLWLALWGVCDAIIHQFAVSYAYNVWDAVRQNNLGMDALYFFPNMTVKALAMFGTLRMGGLLLATALTTMLTRFGGSVMGMLAGNITGQLQAAGTSAEWKTTDPAGRAQSIEANTRALPTDAWAASHTLSNRGGEVFASKSGGTEAYETMSHNFGGPQGAAHMKARGEVGREAGFAGKEMGMEEGPGGLPGAVGLNAFDTASGLNKTNAIRGRYSPESYGRTQAAPDRALADVAAANNMSAPALREAMTKFDTAMGYGNQKAVEGFQGTKNDIQAGDTLGVARGTRSMGDIAYARQIEAAANYAAPGSWKGNHELYNSKTHKLTPKGVAQFIAATQGFIPYSTANGRAEQTLTSSGGLVRSSEEGFFKGHALQVIADKFDKAGYHEAAAELRGIVDANKGVNMGVSYDPQGHPVTGVGGRGAEVNRRDYATGVFGKSSEHINRDVNTTDLGERVKDGYFAERGTSDQTFNRDESIGAYKGADGKTYYGDFFYGNLTNPTTGKQERSVISGQGSNVLNIEKSTTQTTPDGHNFPAKTSETYSQNFQLLKSNSESGTSSSHDDSKKFSGGYKYDNYISSLLAEHGYDRAAQVAGKVQGLLTDVGKYLNLPGGGARRGGTPGPKSGGKGPSGPTK
jgi:hypothetical protein